MGGSLKTKSILRRKKKNRKSVEDKNLPVKCEKETTVRTFDLSPSQKETAKQFALLARTMEDHFSLPRLLDMARVSDLKNPYANLNLLLNTQIVLADGSGYFIWDNDRFEHVISC